MAASTQGAVGRYLLSTPRPEPWSGDLTLLAATNDLERVGAMIVGRPAAAVAGCRVLMMRTQIRFSGVRRTRHLTTTGAVTSGKARARDPARTCTLQVLLHLMQTLASSSHTSKKIHMTRGTSTAQSVSS